jgi:hypothetical protein
MATSTTPALAIGASVGSGGRNRKDDVEKVQKLLNQAGARLAEDGDCGPRTMQAIKGYQRNFLARPDGRVDSGGVTWGHLLAGKYKITPSSFILLPQISGNGYYSYEAMSRQYGTTATIQTLRDVASQFRLNLPGTEIGLGDISFQDGSYMKPHQSHRTGRNVDIRPFRGDGKHMPVTIFDKGVYSQEHTKILVECLLAHCNVKSILFNDSAIRGVKYYDGHHNHLHVNMQE